MRSILLAATAAALCVTAAAAAPTAARRLDEPRWVNEVDQGDIYGAYPKAAMAADISGKAALDCEVAPTGWLKACKVVSETPAGNGFGAAALRLAAKERVDPTTPEGQSVVGWRVRANFDFKPVPPPPVVARGPVRPSTERTASLPAGAIPIEERPEGPAPRDLAAISLPEGRVVYLGASPGQTAFLYSLDDIQRRGDVVTVLYMQVYAHPRFAYGVSQRIVVIRERFDCARHTQEFLGSKSYDDNGAYGLWVPADDDGARPIKPGTAIGQVADILCNNEAPDADAIAVGALAGVTLARRDPHFLGQAT